MKKTFKIVNLHCLNCASKISESLMKIEEIENVNLNFYTGKIILSFKNDFDYLKNKNEILERINKKCDDIEPGTYVESHDSEENYSLDSTPLIFNSDEGRNEKDIEKERTINEIIDNFLKKYGTMLSILIFLFSLLPQLINIKLPLLIVAYVLVGWDIILKSIKNIKRKNFLDENFLMTIATLGAFAIGEYLEGVAVMIFYKIGEYFQERAVENSKKSIEKLLNLKAIYGNKLLENGEVVQLSPEKIEIGDTIIVKRGEKIPLDGRILSQNGMIDNSSLTGESRPIDVNFNDEVLSGSINIGDTIQLKVEKNFNNSTVNKIIELVKNANNNKPHAEKFITKFARIYTPCVVIMAILITLIPPILYGDSFSLWFGRALIFLVISCPCALVLSIPLTFFSSIGYASKNGILVKSGNYLEGVNKIDTIIFDKTGTLTSGKFKVTEIIPSSEITREELISLAQSAEYYSTHPIAKGILSLNSLLFNPENIGEHKEIPGKGIYTIYKNQEILVGSSNFLNEMGIEIPLDSSLENSFGTKLDSFNEMENINGTWIYVSKDKKYAGKILVSDTLKKEAVHVIDTLLKKKFNIYILSGDTKEIVDNIGKRLGLNEKNIYSKLLPEDKVKKLMEIQHQSKNGTIYVGDGINDAPVISQSNIGVSMGGVGTDIAIEASDIVIMEDNLEKLPLLIYISNYNRKILRQNITLAIGTKIVVMVLGVLGIANLWLAIFADVGVSLIAIINASRILRKIKIKVD